MTISPPVDERRAAILPRDHNALIAAVDAACSWLQVTTGPPRDGVWFRLDAVGDEERLVRIRHDIRPHCHGLPAVEATAITGWVAYAVSCLLLAGPVVAGSAPQPEATDLWIGLHPEDAWLDRLAVAPGVEWRATPPANRSPIDVGPTMATFTQLMLPLVEALANRRLLGRRALWGSVADAVAYQALETANVSGSEPEAGMALGRELVAALPGRMEPPRWLTVWRGDAKETMRLKQACCLAYKIPGRGFCLTCPLSDEVTRSARLEQWLAAGSH